MNIVNKIEVRRNESIAQKVGVTIIVKDKRMIKSYHKLFGHE